MANINVYTDKLNLVQAAADLFVERVDMADGRFTVALAGGSTPLPVYELLASSKYAAQVDWSKVHVFFGDERAVPPTHEDSNYGAAQTALLAHIPIPLENVHRIKGELPAEEAADDYEAQLAEFFDGGAPTFDLHFLGMGDDGHTLSLFPGVTSVLEEKERRVVATADKQHDHTRVTMTAWAASASHMIAVLVAGQKKAETLKAVLEGAHQPHKYPIQLIKPAHGEMRWMVDEEAAALLTKADSTG